MEKYLKTHKRNTENIKTEHAKRRADIVVKNLKKEREIISRHANHFQSDTESSSDSDSEYEEVIVEKKSRVRKVETEDEAESPVLKKSIGRPPLSDEEKKQRLAMKKPSRTLESYNEEIQSLKNHIASMTKPKRVKRKIVKKYYQKGESSPVKSIKEKEPEKTVYANAKPNIIDNMRYKLLNF